MVTETKPREKTVDLTGKRLFFDLLHNARRIKSTHWTYQARRAYLLGMMRVMTDNHEDFRIADNMRDVWKCQASGAE